MTKDQARHLAREGWLRFLADPAQIHDAEERLKEFLEEAGSRGVERVFAWWPMPGEISILNILVDQMELDVYLPRILENSQMEFRQFRQGDLLVENRFGIPEPGESASPVQGSLTRGDLVLIPSLAAGPTLARLGRGGGYYDRWKDRMKDAIRLTILPAELVRISFPEDDHDLRMNAIITGEGVVDNMDSFS